MSLPTDDELRHALERFEGAVYAIDRDGDDSDEAQTELDGAREGLLTILRRMRAHTAEWVRGQPARTLAEAKEMVGLWNGPEGNPAWRFELMGDEPWQSEWSLFDEYGSMFSPSIRPPL